MDVPNVHIIEDRAVSEKRIWRAISPIDPGRASAICWVSFPYLRY